MKSKLLILMAAAFCFSCGNNADKQPENETTPETTEATAAPADPATKNFKIVTDANTLREKTGDFLQTDWMLITAGNIDSCNMMTASWKTVGYLWGEPVIICFVRPDRYTYQFMENNDYFTTSLFSEEYRDILQYCGTKSGREVNKIKETGLLPVSTKKGNVYFKQARLVFECQKIYAGNFDPKLFEGKEILEKVYAENEYHKMYIGKIVNCYEEEL